MRLLIYGSKDFALTVKDLARHCAYEVIGMVDDFNEGNGVLGTLDKVASIYPPSEYAMAIAIGYSNIPARWQAWRRVCAAGYSAPNLVHPRAYVADTATLGVGVMVMAGAVVDTRAKLGDLSVVWPGACVNHDVHVGDNCFISPNATLCGHVSIGEDTFVGAGAVIADHSRLPAGSFLKMHSSYSGNRL